MSITDTELRDILALAEKAAQGKWQVISGSEPDLYIRGKEHPFWYVQFFNNGSMSEDSTLLSASNANFVAYANPATVKALCEELLAAREQIAALLNDKAQMQAERKERRP